MDKERLELSEHRNVQSELLLIGNIIRNPSLMNEYAGNLSVDDFVDVANRYFFQVLQVYHDMYGAEEMDESRLGVIASKLADEVGLRIPGMDMKKLAHYFRQIRNVGSLQPADSDAYRNVKRESVLRQLEKAKINVQDICEREDYFTLTGDQILRLVFERLDPLVNASSMQPQEDFGKNITTRALRFFDEPEVGLQTPFSFINEHMHGLCPNDFTLIGGLSNTGKGRFLMNLLVWLVAKEGQSVCLLSNEMTSADFFKAMVCTIINNPDLHDEKLQIPQSNIVQSRFKDDEGEYIERLPGEVGQEFHDRVAENSTEYQQYEAVLRWWEETFPDKFIFVNVANDYSTPRLKQEIRRAKARGCSVIAYDTLKGYQSTEWGDLVQATTDLSELIKSDRNGITGLATFQLTDDVASSRPEELSSQKIARAKHIMHLADNILMFMPLRADLKDDYEIVSYEHLDEDGNPTYDVIGQDASVAAFRIVKTRRGGGKEDIYAVQTNLDLNRWVHIGNLYKVKSQRMSRYYPNAG